MFVSAAMADSRFRRIRRASGGESRRASGWSSGRCPSKSRSGAGTAAGIAVLVRLEQDPEQARADLVLLPGVRAGAEVTGGARLHAVATHLHVPEQRLAEGPGRREVRGRSRRGSPAWEREPGRAASAVASAPTTRTAPSDRDRGQEQRRGTHSPLDERMLPFPFSRLRLHGTPPVERAVTFTSGRGPSRRDAVEPRRRSCNAGARGWAVGAPRKPGRGRSRWRDVDAESRRERAVDQGIRGGASRAQWRGGARTPTRDHAAVPRRVAFRSARGW